MTLIAEITTNPCNEVSLPTTMNDWEREFYERFQSVLPFPTKWQVFNDRGYYIKSDSSVEADYIFKSSKFNTYHRNVLPNYDLAEQIVILEQLITLREEYRRIELHNNSSLIPIDWNDDSKPKYCLIIRKNHLIYIEVYTSINHLLSFQTRTAAELFKDNFQNMILKCKDLLG